jgi:methylamine dehydrogenase accessory protein MauD
VSNLLALGVVTLWILVISQCLVILVMLRHIGVLYERIGPVGALAASSPLKVGGRAPTFLLNDLAGRPISIGRPESCGQIAQLLVFVAPSCPLCAQLTSFIGSFARAERAVVNVILASDGPMEEHRAYVVRQNLAALPYIVSTELGLAYGVSKLPYAVAIDRAGIVRAKGLVNNREHLESILNALETGAASLQEWRARNDKGIVSA